VGLWVVVALLAGASTASAGDAQLTVIHRVVDHLAATEPSLPLVRNALTLVGSESRLAPFAAQRLVAIGSTKTERLSDVDRSVCRVALPAEANTPFTFVTPLTIGRERGAFPTILMRPAADGMAAAIPVDFPVTQETATRVSVVPVPDIARRDMLSDPLAIPPDAILTYAIGIEPTAWEASPPVQFVVTAEDGDRVSELARTRLDPARIPGDRRWVDLRLDLSAFTGSTIRLRFGTRLLPDAPPAPSLPVWGDPTVRAPHVGSHRMNVLLISIDTLRARSVSAYGCSRETTPTLDQRLGAAGVVFEDAISVGVQTLTTHLTLHTGLYPASHGVRSIFHPGLSDGTQTVAEHLRRGGWETAGFTEDGFVLPKPNDRRGFGTYYEDTWGVHPSGTAVETFGLGVDWIRAHRDMPFFVFLHTYEVHAPYAPLPGYDRLFRETVDESDTRATTLLRYEQEVRYADDVIAAVLDELDALGLGTRTLIVVIGDHGDEFWEHGSVQHGLQLYAETLEIPMIMRLPGVIPAGLRVDTPVSLVDVGPTILDLVGAEPIPGADGMSLVPLLRTPPEPLPPRVLLAEAGVYGRPDEFTLAVRMPRYQCMIGPRGSMPVPECYDRATDPGMHNRLTRSGPWIFQTLSERNHYDGLGVRLPVATSVPAYDVDRENKLRALGYLQ
jgi:hypothetical protein